MLKEFKKNDQVVKKYNPIFKSSYDIKINKTEDSKIISYLEHNAINVKVSNKKIKIIFNLNDIKGDADMELKNIFNEIKNIKNIEVKLCDKHNEVIFKKSNKVRLKDYEYELDKDSNNIVYLKTKFKKI